MTTQTLYAFIGIDKDGHSAWGHTYAPNLAAARQGLIEQGVVDMILQRGADAIDELRLEWNMVKEVFASHGWSAVCVLNDFAFYADEAMNDGDVDVS